MAWQGEQYRDEVVLLLLLFTETHLFLVMISNNFRFAFIHLKRKNEEKKFSEQTTTADTESIFKFHLVYVILYLRMTGHHTRHSAASVIWIIYS